MTAPMIRRRVFPVSKARLDTPRKVESRVLPASPFAGVDWSVAYVAFLIYVTSITTQRFSIGTATMSVALLTLVLERRPIRLPGIVLWSLALLAWSAVGLMTTEYPAIVLDQLGELAKICGVLFVGVNVISTRGRLRTLLVVMLVCFIIYPLRGTLLNYASGETLQGRAIWNSIYSNPNDLAGLCILQLALVLGMLEVERQKWLRLVGFVTALVIPVIILLTQSRGAFIALTAFGLVVARRHIHSGRKVAMLMGALVAILFLTPDSVWTRIGSMGQTEASDGQQLTEAEGSARQRLEILRVAESIVAANPVTGIGLGAYGNAHYVYAQSPRFDPIARGHRDTHNTYVSLMAETGLVGFACFMMLVFVTLREARRSRKKLQATQPALASQLFFFELGAYGYLIAGIWGSYGRMVDTYIFFAIVYAAARLLAQEAVPTTTAAAPVRRGTLRVANGGAAVRRRAIT